MFEKNCTSSFHRGDGWDRLKRFSDSNIITIIHCVKNGWLLQLLMLPVNIWMGEEVHYLQLVFLWASLFTRGAMGTLPQNVFSEILKSNKQSHWLDAISYYLIFLCGCSEVLWTHWALFNFVFVVFHNFYFNYLKRVMDCWRTYSHRNQQYKYYVSNMSCLRALSWTCSRHVRTDGRQICQQLSRGGSHKVRTLIWFDYLWCLPYIVLLHRCCFALCYPSRCSWTRASII